MNAGCRPMKEWILRVIPTQLILVVSRFFSIPLFPANQTPENLSCPGCPPCRKQGRKHRAGVFGDNAAVVIGLRNRKGSMKLDSTYLGPKEVSIQLV